MSIKVFLNLGEGNVSVGFDRINSRVEIDGEFIAQIQASLPGNSQLDRLHHEWQFGYVYYYDKLVNPLRNYDEIEIDSGGVTGAEAIIFTERTIELTRAMGEWLDSSSFAPIANQLQDRLSEDRAVIVIIESIDDRIYRLPWHCWRAIVNYPQAEITFTLNTFQRPTCISTRTKPRILAVFGDSRGIDVSVDSQLIAQLPADLVTLPEPTIAEFRRKIADRQGWDLLFFAGHSSDRDVGIVYLNQTESVTLTELRDALARAIEGGLQLAIFNSCSGLRLATSLAKLNLNSAIVMREGLPNQAALDFLTTFLHSFVGGNSLLTAVAAGKKQLESIESKFPCASWLPVVFWNPTTTLPTWTSFYPPPPVRIPWWQLASIILATTVGIWGIRSQGYLESAELAAYDLAIDSRPIAEAPDDRILIVGIAQNEPINDRVLFQALQKLQQSQPKAIGVDIYRDRSFGEGHQNLTTLLQQQNSIISSCLISGDSSESPGVAAPNGVDFRRVGFTNFSLDSDKIIRRQILGMAPAETSQGCKPDHALSLRLALKYLGIPEAKEAENGNLKIGTQELAVLSSSVGAYRSTAAQDNLRGFQVMLNYRNAAQVAPQVSLEQLLTDRVDRQQIAGKVVIIGYVGQGSGDTFLTPSKMTEMPGVLIHAHMTSNLLSHLLVDRALITTWSDSIEFAWIFLWGTIGGVIWFRLKGWQIWIVEIGAMAILLVSSGICFYGRSVWVPLIPSQMAVVITPLLAVGSNWWQSKDQPAKQAR